MADFKFETARFDPMIEKFVWEEDQNNFFGGLGAMNTVADFVSELYDSLFRDILGHDVMDRTLGSFDKRELFQVMSRIFLQEGNEKLLLKTDK